MKIAMSRRPVLALLAAPSWLTVGVKSAAAADEPRSALELAPLGRTEGAAHFRAYEARLAETAYLYAVPPFPYLRQRYEFVQAFVTHMPQRGNPFGQFLLLRASSAGQRPGLEGAVQAVPLGAWGGPVAISG